MSGTSPVARQRELGTRLRALRNERGMTVEEVAAELLCSTTKIAGWRRPRAAPASATSVTCAYSMS